MNKNSFLLIGCLLNLAFNLSAQIQFEERIIVDDTYLANGPISVYAADLDGDGDKDILLASILDQKISWYENEDGLGNFGVPKVIATPARSNTVYATDLDGDGDMDVLSAANISDRIVWYENLDGLGNFGTEQIISTNAFIANSVYAADIDGDGDMDVLSASATVIDVDKIAWYENEDGQGNFGPQQIISQDAIGASSVKAADLDGDGDKDVLSASRDDNKIAWYENLDGIGDFGTEQVITINALNATSVNVADLDGDGDMDVLSASHDDNKIAWYENTDGLGNYSDQQVINQDAIGAQFVFVSDLDGDGDEDVLSASRGDNKIAWYENLDGLGDFGNQQIITTNAIMANSVYTADLDDDGDMDVLSVSGGDDKTAWYENMDGLGNFGEEALISFGGEKPMSVFAADIDGDNDVDVLVASKRQVVWYENLDGMGSFGAERNISGFIELGNFVYAADLDADGDLDVLSASTLDNKIAWYENLDGLGNFGAQQVIQLDIGAKSVYASDLDGDGDLDALSASGGNDKIAWYKNQDGLGDFGTQQIINDNIDAVHTLFPSDLDGDGDMDVLSAAFGMLLWHENLDGLGNFSDQQLIYDGNGMLSVYATDIDNDGDMDALSVTSFSILWHENTNGSGDFGSPQVISENVVAANSVYAIDIDNDGDMDVLSSSRNDDKIAWYENTDGLGSFGSQQIISTNADSPYSVYAADIDGDGDADVLSASVDDSKVAWYENLGVVGLKSPTDLATLDFDIYPNPTKNIITIKSPSNITQIKIYNSLGQVMLWNNNKREVDLSTLANGLYFCKVKDLDGNFGIRKVVKE